MQFSIGRDDGTVLVTGSNGEQRTLSREVALQMWLHRINALFSQIVVYTSVGIVVVCGCRFIFCDTSQKWKQTTCRIRVCV